MIQLKEETDKYKKLKICKYVFELSKIGILSLSVGLSFISVYLLYYQFNINSYN